MSGLMEPGTCEECGRKVVVTRVEFRVDDERRPFVVVTDGKGWGRRFTDPGTLVLLANAVGGDRLPLEFEVTPIVTAHRHRLEVA